MFPGQDPLFGIFIGLALGDQGFMPLFTDGLLFVRLGLPLRLQLGGDLLMADLPGLDLGLLSGDPGQEGGQAFGRGPFTLQDDEDHGGGHEDADGHPDVDAQTQDPNGRIDS